MSSKEMSSKEMQKTLKLLMKMPMYKELINENKVLTERIRSLEYAVQYLESKNAKLEKKLSKKQKVEKIIDLSYDDDDDEENGNISIVIEENTKKNTLDAKYPDYNKVVIKQEAVVIKKDVEEEEEEKEEEVVEEDKVVIVVEEEEEEEEEDEEEEEEEEVEKEEEEEEEVEKEEEEDVEKEEEEEEEVDGVYEIEINGKTYYVSNETDSIIYEADEEGEITIEAGVYKNGKPVFA